MTSIQSDIWQDHTTLFGQAIGQYPEDPNIREYYASGLWTAEKVDSALYHIEYAINELGLVKSSSFSLLANCYASKGEAKKAIAFYNEALRLDETNVIARYHRGIQLLEVDPAAAIQDFNICEQSQNSYISRLVYAPRGRAYGMLAQFDQAIEDLEQAIAYFPDDLDNYLDRAITYEYMGREDKAKDDYSTVLKRNPSYNLASERIQALESANL
jgi:tetratricopeptide (TPR) repeat protein